MNDQMKSMMNRLFAALSQDELYLVAMGLASIEKRFEKEPERVREVYGSFGDETCRRFFSK